MRHASLRVLERVLRDLHSEEILAAICNLLTDTDSAVRTAALTLVQRVATLGDPVVLRALYVVLQSEDPVSRQLALRGLRSLARPGDRETLEATVVHLEDRDHEVRAAAVSALGELSAVHWFAIRNLADRAHEAPREEPADRVSKSNPGNLLLSALVPLPGSEGDACLRIDTVESVFC